MDRDDDSVDDLLDGRPFVRRLVCHQESDSLFEIKTDLEWESCAENGCDDVTGIEEFEKAFEEQELKEKKRQDAMPKIRTN